MRLLPRIKDELANDPLLSEFRLTASSVLVATLLLGVVIGINAFAVACGLGLGHATTKGEGVLLASIVFVLSPAGLLISLLALFMTPTMPRWSALAWRCSVMMLGVLPFPLMIAGARIARAIHS